MARPLRILFIEDCETDTLLMAAQLEDGGYEPTYRRVETAADLEKALESDEWELAVCDFRIPGFGAEPALEIVKKRRPGLPFIVVSGVVRVADVVSLLRMGAVDFVEKSDLDRLNIAVERAIDVAHGMDGEPFRTMVEEGPDAILVAEPDGRLIYANRRAEEMLGYSAAELRSMSYLDLHPAWDAEKNRRTFESIEGEGMGRLVTAVARRKDGTEFPVDIAGRVASFRGRRVLIGSFRDLTLRK